jgi:hypothetical protein
MANARSRFDAISAYLRKAHDARALTIRGRPCLGIDGATFIAFHRDGMGIRLGGRALTQTLSLPGARPWHPIDPERVAPGWVWIPSIHAWRWDRLAIEAWRCAQDAALARQTGAVDAEIQASADPPPSSGSSLAQRFAAAIARGFGGMSLARAA